MAKKAAVGLELTTKTIGAIPAKALLEALEEHRGGSEDIVAARSALLEVLSPDDLVWPFEGDVERFVDRAIAAADTPPENAERLHVSLRAMFRWDRTARLALAASRIDVERAAALIGPLDRARS